MAIQADNPKLILASASAIRANLLEAAGLTFEVQVSNFDEGSFKTAFAQRPDAVGGEDLAAGLAQEKAFAISTANPDALVIGADQVLSCGNTLFDKPRNRDEAVRNLKSLRGRTHTLHCSAVVARGGVIAWRTNEEANLTMRNWSDQFLDTYLDEVGNAVFASVGAYQLENRGAQLFSAIDGDYFTILGLPLLPLLGFLRGQGILPS